MNVLRTLASVVVTTALTTLAAGCEIEQPFEGPGYDLSDGLTSDAPGPFVVATTRLVIDDGDGDQQAFDGPMAKLTEALKTQPGLVGKSLGFGIGVSGYRTLSVWESEEAVLGWVTSEVHSAAMSEMAERVKDGATLSWTMTRDELEAAPPSWADAKARLDADGRTAY